METIFMTTENSRTNEPHKFILNLSKRLDLRSSDKHVALQNLSIYYTWKNIRKQYKNNKLKIIAPTRNGESELPNGSYSVSDIQDYIEFITKKHETLTAIPPIHVYINRIKIKIEYKLELQTPKTMKLFGSIKKLINKTKNGENVPSLEVVEVVLVQCNLVDNQHPQKSEALCTFMSNKSYCYLLNVEPSNLAFFIILSLMKL